MNSNLISALGYSLSDLNDRYVSFPQHSNEHLSHSIPATEATAPTLFASPITQLHAALTPQVPNWCWSETCADPHCTKKHLSMNLPAKQQLDALGLAVPMLQVGEWKRKVATEVLSTFAAQ